MSTHPWSERAVVAVLGVLLLLLADAFIVVPRPSVAAVPGVDASIEELPLGDGANGCGSGFEDTRSKADMSLQGVAVTGGGAIAVGFSRRHQSNDYGRRKPVAIRNASGKWLRTPTRSPGKEDGLVAVAAGRGNNAWAVGFTTIGGQVMPLAMRWDGRRWSVSRPRPLGSLTAMFTDVAAVGKAGDPFAVGYRMTASGRRLPVAARKTGKHWRYVNPHTGPRESVTLTGVTRDLKGGLWAVGHGGPGALIRPVIYRRFNNRWQRQGLPNVSGEGVLADVVAPAIDDAWAVGYQRDGGRSMPLVLRYDGTRWRRVEAPSFDSSDVVLTAASVAPEGGIWVVGAAWDAAIGDYEAVAAWWDGQAWNEVAGIDGGNELHDVVGSLDGDGWAVGRAGQQARATRVCTPAQTGIFGGSEPSQPDAPTAGSPSADASGTGVVAGTAASSSTTAGSGKAVAAKKRSGRQRKRGRSRSLPAPLPKARGERHLVARNVTREAGLSMKTTTYGAEVADFDGDGVNDLFLGRHGARALLLLDRNGRFVVHKPMRFPSIDRHGCSVADIDGSGLPDLYCTIGSKRGSSLKANELWIDPGGPAPYDAATNMGLSDPTGRGRNAEFLEVRSTPRSTLVVTNSPTRVDGLPSPGRLFRSSGTGTFSARARIGFAPRLGSLSTQAADFDRDGRDDLLMVTGGQQAPERQETRLYRNTSHGLVDVTRRMGISWFGEVDAELVDINGDRKLDLVQLSPTRLRISVQRNGRFVRSYERSLTNGRAIASGDVNADGRGDLYIVRSNGHRNSADVMLINRKEGRLFSSLRIPQTYTGDGDDAVAIDYDGNGRDDFVVLNGRSGRGPLELIAFYGR